MVSSVKFCDYKRITARVNNDLTINNFLSATIDFYFKNSNRKQPSVPGIVWLTRRMPPQYAAEWTDGRVAEGKIGDNPWGRLKYGGFNNNWSNKLGGKVSIDFTPFKGFKFSSVLAPSLNFYKSKMFNKQVPYYAWDDPTEFRGYLDGQVQTSLDEKRNDNYSITTQLLANYITTLGKHNLNILAGNENFYAFYENLGASRNEFELTSFPYLNLGSLEYRDNSGEAYENAYQSWFGRIMYNYANKYLFQSNIRFDGSSRFHSDYRWGSFPSFSAGWIITEESFMKNISTLSFLKLRASWGALGNERIGNYPYQATIAFSNALFYAGNEVVSAQGAAQQKYAINDISWEKTESTNFGIDSYWFNNHFRFTADYFIKTTKDMLLPLEIPKFIGFDNPDQNTGKMETKGWELEFGWNEKIGEVNISVSANLSDFKSIMGDLGGTEFLGAQVKKEGSEFNEWYGYLSDGLFQTQEEVNSSAVTSSAVKPGDVKYIDVNGPDGKPDGIISPEYDRVLLGGSLPRYMYGGNIQLMYKNFDFQMVIQGVGKQNARIDPNMARPLQTQNTHVPEYIDGNYWSMFNSAEQNLNSKYPRLSEVTAGNNYTMSDFWLFNGSYLRMKNITLGYNFPQKLTEKIKMQDVRIYASASDLFSLDKYPQGWDPEVSGTSYPITASFIFGISVKF
jgi:TonB-linked SusC/RagA family outer membrane protein